MSLAVKRLGGGVVQAPVDTERGEKYQANSGGPMVLVSQQATGPLSVVQL